jgi:Uma2 family endonuclease
VPGLRHHAPDLAVFAGVWERPQEGIFDLKASGGHVLLVIEVTSPATRHLDVASPHPDAKTRFRHYAWAGIPLYLIVDAARRSTSKGQALPIFGYELTEDGYQPLPLNEHGRLWVPPVKMWLGTRGTEVVCFDEHGEEIRRYEQEQAARLELEEQLRLEQQSLRAAEERARELERKLRQLEENRTGDA